MVFCRRCKCQLLSSHIALSFPYRLRRICFWIAELRSCSLQGGHIYDSKPQAIIAGKIAEQMQNFNIIEFLLLFKFPSSRLCKIVRNLCRLDSIYLLFDVISILQPARGGDNPATQIVFKLQSASLVTSNWRPAPLQQLQLSGGGTKTKMIWAEYKCK